MLSAFNSLDSRKQATVSYVFTGFTIFLVEHVRFFRAKCLLIRCCVVSSLGLPVPVSYSFHSRVRCSVLSVLLPVPVPLQVYLVH